jgi:SAM-dependent methyltransferase
LAGLAAEQGAEAEGIDIAQSMIDLARRLHPAASFRTGDACALPYADGSFGAVVCNFGVHHLSDTQVGLREFHRVLHPATRLAFSVWNEETSGLDVVPSAIYGAQPVFPEDIPAPPPVPGFSSPEEAAPALSEAGLELLDLRRVTFIQEYPSAVMLWEGWLAAAIRTKPIFEAQTEEVRERARALFRTSISDYTNRDGSVSFPVAIDVVVARRPD